MKFAVTRKDVRPCLFYADYPKEENGNLVITG
jgi:hypothetical protein